MIVKVGHPDVCGQIGHHTLSDAMEDALAATCARTAEVTRVTGIACFDGL